MESLAVRLGRLNPGGISFVTPEEDDRMMINTMKKMARESGLKEGQKIGRKDGINFIVKNMLQNGVAIEDIVRLTNVDKDLVEKVARELKLN